MNKPNPDDRRDNESKIKRAMSNTQSQMEAANEVIAETDDPKKKADLQAKNERRARALEGMEAEMKQEAEYNKTHD